MRYKLLDYALRATVAMRLHIVLGNVVRAYERRRHSVMVSEREEWTP
jgi:hypothetical protein